MQKKHTLQSVDNLLQTQLFTPLYVNIIYLVLTGLFPKSIVKGIAIMSLKHKTVAIKTE